MAKIKLIDREVPVDLLTPGVKVFCVVCKTRGLMVDPKMAEVGEGMTSYCIVGGCPNPGCDRMTYRFIGSGTQTNHPKGYWTDVARARRAKVRAAKILDSMPKIEAAYS